jgi:hypothetical protein
MRGVSMDFVHIGLRKVKLFSGIDGLDIRFAHLVCWQTHPTDTTKKGTLGVWN